MDIEPIIYIIAGGVIVYCIFEFVIDYLLDKRDRFHE